MNERERIELLMKCYDLSPSQFAERTGIQRASVSHIISGRNKPSLEVMLKVYDAFPGVDMKWLMTGIGEVPVRQSAEAVAPETIFQQPVQASLQPQNDLFAAPEPSVAPVVEDPKPRRTAVFQAAKEKSSDLRAKRAQVGRYAQMMAVQPDKKIKEVRIYYSDGTYETLIPESR